MKNTHQVLGGENLSATMPTKMGDDGGNGHGQEGIAHLSPVNLG